MSFERVRVGEMLFSRLTEAQAVETVRRSLERGEGGRIFTPNLDILRQARLARPYLAYASLVVADGTPVVWASRLAGTPLPARVAGADLVWSLARMAARDDYSLFVLGGEPHPERGGARRAADVLRGHCPELRVAGALSPAYGFDQDPRQFHAVREELADAKPDLVYVGLGFPRQEQVISALRPELPGAWFLGCGGAVNFVAGDQPRAPRWMRRSGLEWLHRLGSEPRRLGRRYLRDCLPFAARLLLGATLARYRGDDGWSYQRYARSHDR